MPKIKRTRKVKPAHPHRSKSQTPALLAPTATDPDIRVIAGECASAVTSHGRLSVGRGCVEPGGLPVMLITTVAADGVERKLLLSESAARTLVVLINHVYR